MELPHLQAMLDLFDDQRQLPIDHVDLLAPAFGIGLTAIALPRCQGPFPKFHLAPCRAGAQQHRSAVRVFASPRQLFNAPGVAQLRRLDQGTESHAQGFGNQVQCGQADILLARLDRDQHAPADP
ncbi:hypothetical protein D3C72_1930580 [compost metagenome]